MDYSVWSGELCVLLNHKKKNSSIWWMRKVIHIKFQNRLIAQQFFFFLRYYGITERIVFHNVIYHYIWWYLLDHSVLWFFHIVVSAHIILIRFEKNYFHIHQHIIKTLLLISWEYQRFLIWGFSDENIETKREKILAKFWHHKKIFFIAQD